MTSLSWLSYFQGSKKWKPVFQRIRCGVVLLSFIYFFIGAILGKNMYTFCPLASMTALLQQRLLPGALANSSSHTSVDVDWIFHTFSPAFMLYFMC